MIGTDGERERKSENSVLLAWLDNDIYGFTEPPSPLPPRVGDTLNCNFCKTGTGVLDQVYHVTASPPGRDVELSFFFFFGSYLFLIIYLFSSQYDLITMRQKSRRGFVVTWLQWRLQDTARGKILRVHKMIMSISFFYLVTDIFSLKTTI